MWLVIVYVPSAMVPPMGVGSMAAFWMSSIVVATLAIGVHPPMPPVPVVALADEALDDEADAPPAPVDVAVTGVGLALEVEPSPLELEPQAISAAVKQGSQT